jgi:predicted RNA polymerase sigma factor
MPPLNPLSRRDFDAGREALCALETDPKLARYSFYWAARANVERRGGRTTEAREHYLRAVELATSRAERVSYERRVRALGNGRG